MKHFMSGLPTITQHRYATKHISTNPHVYKTSFSIVNIGTDSQRICDVLFMYLTLIQKVSTVVFGLNANEYISFTLVTSSRLLTTLAKPSYRHTNLTLTPRRPDRPNSMRREYRIHRRRRRRSGNDHSRILDSDRVRRRVHSRERHNLAALSRYVGVARAVRRFRSTTRSARCHHARVSH